MVNGSNSLSGRVEISINGEWGSVCGASYWDDKDASVLCRMMNHSSGRALNYGHYGSGSGPIWIGHMRCKGDEDSIFHCPMNFNSRYSGETSNPFYQRSLVSRSLVIRQFGCTTHHTDAGVQCYDTGMYLSVLLISAEHGATFYNFLNNLTYVGIQTSALCP